MVAARRPRPRQAVRKKKGRLPAARSPAFSVLDPIITLDNAGTIQSVSDGIEPLFGWTPTELCGQNVNTLIPEPRRSDLDRYLDRYRNPSRATVVNRVRRFDALRKDGSIVTIELSVSRADLPGHSDPYFVGVIRDVSGEIDVTSDTPQDRTRIQKFITEQTRALATAHLRLQLSDRLASLGTMAAGLGHDLNNVLLPIRARLNAIEHSGLPEASMKHLRQVRYSLGYLQHLSNGLHYLSLDPHGEGFAQENPVPTSLSIWWKQVGRLLRSALPKHVRLTAVFPASLPKVAIAPHWLTQAILNIIINAGEAIPVDRRGGLVSMTAAFMPRDKRIRLSVRDNGRGMSREVQRRALDPFFTTKSRSIGTGLGLPLAQKVLDRAKGSIKITSAPGKGTTIALLLPLANRRAATNLLSQSGRRLAAVTVGDEKASLLLSQMLIAVGFEVARGTGASTGGSELWITEPTPSSLTKARRWREGKPDRQLILFGEPSIDSRHDWAALKPITLPVDGDFNSIRHVITGVFKALRTIPPKRKAS